MVVKVCGVITAEGNEKEMAVYTALVLDILKAVTDAHEEEKARKEIQIDQALANMTLDQLMRMERGDDADCGTS